MGKDAHLEIADIILAEYTYVRTRLAVLLSEADRYADILQRAGSYLRYDSEGTLRSGSDPPDLAGFPSEVHLRTLIEETLSVIVRKKRLLDHLKTIGAEPKE